MAAQPGPEADEDAFADNQRFDQHRDNQQDADKGRNGAGGEREDCLDLHLLAVDHGDAGYGQALAQHLVDEDGEEGTDETADDTAAAAENGGAADDHGGDDDQLGAEPVLRGDALVLRDRHQARNRRAQRRQQVGTHPHPPRRNAGIDRGLLVAAGSEGFVAPPRLGEHDGADRDDRQRNRNLVVEPKQAVARPGVELAELEEPAIVRSLQRIKNRLPAGQAENEPSADEQYGQRRDERGHAQERDQYAVDEADQCAEQEANQDRREDAEIVVVGVEHVGEGDTDQAVGRADRQVEILVGDDEGHADRHDRVARGIAEQRLECVGRQEELGIDEGAEDVEQRHHDEEANLPATDELGRAAAKRGRK